MDTQKRIRELMTERGWTDYRLAKEANLSHSTVTNMFNKNNAPTLPTLEAVCQAFGITLAQFFAEGEEAQLTEEQQKLFSKWSTLTGQAKTDSSRSDGCHLKHIDPTTGKDVLFFLLFSHSVNSIYHLSNLSTQHPQYQNQPLNSPSFSTVDQFPLTHKMKKSGIQNLSSDKSRLPEIPCSLHFFAI